MFCIALCRFSLLCAALHRTASLCTALYRCTPVQSGAKDCTALHWFLVGYLCCYIQCCLPWQLVSCVTDCDYCVCRQLINYYYYYYYYYYYLHVRALG